MTLPEQVMARLPYEVYLGLEKQVALPGLSDKTTPIEAGYAMGVERVLRLLRNGFVINPKT